MQLNVLWSDFAPNTNRQEQNSLHLTGNAPTSPPLPLHFHTFLQVHPNNNLARSVQKNNDKSVQVRISRVVMILAKLE
jgi:hypothetical protein